MSLIYCYLVSVPYLNFILYSVFSAQTAPRALVIAASDQTRGHLELMSLQTFCSQSSNMLKADPHSHLPDSLQTATGGSWCHFSNWNVEYFQLVTVSIDLGLARVNSWKVSFFAGFSTENHIYSLVGMQMMEVTLYDILERLKRSMIDSCAEHDVIDTLCIKGSQCTKVCHFTSRWAYLSGHSSTSRNHRTVHNALF